MRKIRRLKAFCECLPILFGGWFWGLHDWEYIDEKTTLSFWKQRYNLILKNNKFIL